MGILQGLPEAWLGKASGTFKFPYSAYIRQYRLTWEYLIPWVLSPLSNSWIIIIIWLYIALSRTPNIDSYWVGAVPN